MRIFLIAAIVLAVLAIIAAASNSGTCLDVDELTWFVASWLAYLTDLFFGWRPGPVPAWERDPSRRVMP